jgi:hypothetical protein
VRACLHPSLPAGTVPRIAHRRAPGSGAAHLPEQAKSFRLNGHDGEKVVNIYSSTCSESQVSCQVLVNSSLLSIVKLKMRTFTAQVGVAALFVGTASAQLYPGQSKLNHTCQLQKPLLSCPSSDPSKVDSCCVETFGGLLLSTQFWNTNSGGSGQLLPKDTFTLHGLWVAFYG